MKHSTLTRFFLIGALVALVLGTACLYGLRALNESSTSEMRRHMALSFAQEIESGPYTESIHDVHGRGHRGAGSNLWVYDSQGNLLASNIDDPPTINWEDMHKPTEVHDFSLHYRALRIVPDYTLIRLEAPQPTYLLIESRRSNTLVALIWGQGAFILSILAIAALAATGMIWVYMRRTSIEARKVLARLESGDLKARFEIHRIDEVGSLMLDFNRMAAEIERLVRRVQETESARKHLLEELSHDLRTPLTSLRTSIETLADHGEDMTSEQRREFLKMSSNEMNYFLRLLDDLFFVADLGEPRYKKTSEKIDIAGLLEKEIHGRITQDTMVPRTWEIDVVSKNSADTSTIGDPVLLRRLFKNALDNASKHASDSVRVHIEAGKQNLIVNIDDDGPGISDEAVELFGQRRRQRIVEGEAGRGLSLGLGSVIMRTLLELHGGALQIQRRLNHAGLTEGTRLTLILPKV